MFTCHSVIIILFSIPIVIHFVKSYCSFTVISHVIKEFLPIEISAFTSIDTGTVHYDEKESHVTDVMINVLSRKNSMIIGANVFFWRRMYPFVFDIFRTFNWNLEFIAWKCFVFQTFLHFGFMHVAFWNFFLKNRTEFIRKFSAIVSFSRHMVNFSRYQSQILSEITVVMIKKNNLTF